MSLDLKTLRQCLEERGYKNSGKVRPFEETPMVKAITEWLTQKRIVIDGCGQIPKYVDGWNLCLNDLLSELGGKSE